MLLMKEAELSGLLKAIAVPSRLRIVELLRDRAYCVNALTRKLSISQPAVSQHLGILKRVGLVDSHRVGTMVHYRVNAERFDKVLEALESLGGRTEGAAVR